MGPAYHKGVLLLGVPGISLDFTEQETDSDHGPVSNDPHCQAFGVLSTNSTNRWDASIKDSCYRCRLFLGVYTLAYCSTMMLMMLIFLTTITNLGIFHYDVSAIFLNKYN